MISSQGPDSASVTAQLLRVHTWNRAPPVVPTSGLSPGARDHPPSDPCLSRARSRGECRPSPTMRGVHRASQRAQALLPGLGSPTGLGQPYWPLVGEPQFTFHVSLQPLLGISPAPGHSEPLSAHLSDSCMAAFPFEDQDWHLCHWILSVRGQGHYGSATAVCPVEPSPWPVLGTQ